MTRELLQPCERSHDEPARAGSRYARLKRRRARHLRRRRHAAIAFGAALLAGAGAGALAAQEVQRALLPAGARLATIAVLGHQRLPAREIAEASGMAAGAPLAGLDVDEVARALRAHAWVREARAWLSPDATLVLQVQEREPVALLRSGGEDAGWRFVERDGTPIAPVGRTGDGAAQALLRIESPRPLPSGVASAAVARAIDLAQQVARLGLARPTRVVLPSVAGDTAAAPAASADAGATPSPGWRLRLGPDGSWVTLGTRDLDARLARLATLARLRPQLVADAACIDLRFRERAILRTRDTLLATPHSDATGPAAGEEGGGAG